MIVNWKFHKEEEDYDSAAGQFECSTFDESIYKLEKMVEEYAKTCNGGKFYMTVWHDKDSFSFSKKLPKTRK